MNLKNFFKKKVFLVAGPCSVESKEQVFKTAEKIKDHIDVFRAGIWKPRTKPSSFSGLGDISLEWLTSIQKVFGLKVMTEVGNTNHVEKCLKAGIDMLWIGARTTVNPFYIQEIAESLRGVNIPVFIKNPIHPDIGLWIGAFERFHQIGVVELAAIHRGFFTYESSPFRNDPKWEIPIKLKKEIPNLPIISDPSHIAGEKRFIYDISQTALDLNMNGLMIETHINPAEALSDPNQQIVPEDFLKLVKNLTVKESKINNKKIINEIKTLRGKIDLADKEIVELLRYREQIVKRIAKIKKANNVTIFQIERWNEILTNRRIEAKQLNIEEKMLTDIFELIHKYAILLQAKIIK